MRRLAWIPAVVWMCIIFYLSHQPATVSSELSGGITEWFMNFVADKFPFVYNNFNLDGVHTLVRKNAHLIAYFILSILVMYPLRSSGVKNAAWCTFGICVIYAISDEFHQTFIPGRSGEIRDVLIDSIGATAGILGYLGVVRRGDRKNR